MPKDLTGRKIGVIHASIISTRAVQKYIDEILPGVEVVHWVDDTIEIRTRLCGEAFQMLKAGHPEKHNDMLLAEIETLSKEVDAIVLAQVSMTALEPHLKQMNVPIYNSGRTAFNRIREILESL